MDEPFGALDALTRQQMQEELLAIRERARITTLLVTHDVEEALFLADRVVVLEPRPGRIKQIHSIDLPHPRQRSSLAFHRLREALLHQLTADDRYLPAAPVQIDSLPLSYLAY
ncbi:Bicarbonate transport ATP-binding protein CmpC [compost metagenome]